MASGIAGSLRRAGWFYVAWRLLLGTAVLGLALAGILAAKKANWPALLTWMQDNPGKVLPIYLVAAILGSIALIPGPIFMMLAGTLYGIALGSLLSWIGVVTGQLCAFLLGRSMFKDTLTVWIHKRFPTWIVIERALFQQGGLKLILLIRLSPILPDSVVSYAMSITKVDFGVFCTASFISLVPYCLMYTSVGAASSDIAKTISGGGGGDQQSNPKARIVMLVVSGVFLAILLYYGSVTLKRALAEAQAADDAAAASDDPDASRGGADEPSDSADDSAGACVRMDVDLVHHRHHSDTRNGQRTSESQPLLPRR